SEPCTGDRGSRQAKHGCFARESGQDALTERRAIPGRQGAASVHARTGTSFYRSQSLSIGIRRKKRRCDSAQMETRTRRYRIVALRQAISSPNVSVNTRLQGKLSTMPHPVRRRLLAVTIAFAASGSAL